MVLSLAEEGPDDADGAGIHGDASRFGERVAEGLKTPDDFSGTGGGRRDDDDAGDRKRGQRGTVRRGERPKGSQAALRSSKDTYGGEQSKKGVKVEGENKGPRQQKDTIALPDPHTDNPVDRDQMYKILRFDPNGVGEIERAVPESVQHLKSTIIARRMREDAVKSMREKIKAGNLPTSRPHNNAAYAFRHTLGSYKVAKKLGPALAKEIGDAHEVTAVNTEGERLMDLYNNEVGRRLAADRRNHSRPDEEVILEALRKGKLRERSSL